MKNPTGETNSLEEKFRARWPDFFANVYCGFYLPDKWANLVWALCEQLEWRIKCVGETNNVLKVAQVKEKFFGLRFYYDYSGEHYEAIEGAVSLAEALSVCPEFALERGVR